MARPELLSAGVTIRRCTPADQAALLALHRSGFVNQWDDAFWRWRFVDNPLGRTELTGAFTADGRCLASFAGVPLPCRMGGELRRVHASGDVVLSPDLRRGLGGSRLLQRVSELYFSGFGDPDTWLVLGCPEPPLRRMIVRHLGCEVLGDVLFLAREAGTPIGPATVAVEHGASLPDDLEGLWQRCAAEWTSGLVRDRAYLEWRYVRHPRVRYTFLVARGEGGALRGLSAVRDGGYHAEVFSLVDWLVPREDGAAAASLLATAAQLAAARGRRYLLAMFAPSSPEFLRFQEHGFRVRPTPYQAVFRSYAAGVDRQFLFDHWYQTMGDLDFV
jgi:hypothetical protein